MSEEAEIEHIREVSELVKEQPVTAEPTWRHAVARRLRIGESAETWIKEASELLEEWGRARGLRREGPVYVEAWDYISVGFSSWFSGTKTDAGKSRLRGMGCPWDASTGTGEQLRGQEEAWPANDALPVSPSVDELEVAIAMNRWPLWVWNATA